MSHAEPAGFAAERAVLGACLQERAETVERAQRILPDVDAFGDIRHAKIWAGINTLVSEGVPPHPISLNDHLLRHGRPWTGADSAYLAELAGTAPGLVGTIEYSARIVADAARTRGIRVVMARMAQMLDDGHRDPGSVILDAQAELAALATQRADNPYAAGALDGHSFFVNVAENPIPVWGEGTQVLWAQGESLMIVGPPGVGKSTLTMQLVRARLGIGDPDVLGLPVRVDHGRLLYLAMDRPPQLARAGHRVFTGDDAEANETLAQRVTVWPKPPRYDFAKHPETLADMCKAFGATTVVIDSLKDAALRLSDDETGSGYQRARLLCLSQGVEMIEIHHNRKANGENKSPNTLADVYGSAWLTAGAGSVVFLWGEAGDVQVELKHLKQPAEVIGPWKIIHEHGTGEMTRALDVDLLRMTNEWTSGMTRRRAAQLIGKTDKPSKADTNRADYLLRRYLAAGLVQLTQAQGKTGQVAYYLTERYVQEPPEDIEE